MTGWLCVDVSESSISLLSGVSGAILKAAGPTVEEECKKLGSH